MKVMQRKLDPGRGRTTSLLAPVKGWNARDSLADMDPGYAVKMVNWFPRNTYVQMRKGYTQYCTGISGLVESLMQYSGGASSKLFCAAGTKIYQVTAGAVGAAAVSGCTNARWQYVNNTTSGGSYIQMVNGADKMKVYTGSAWAKDGDGAPYDVTGFDTSTATNIALAHNRVWFTQSGTLKAWYLATGAIGGAASSLDLSSFCFRGGQLIAIGNWTMDAGYGVDDMTAFVTSNGEVLVYRGSDPSSVSTWALVGVWWIGSPVGKRCLVKYDGDLLIICQDGVQPMSLALQSTRLNPRVALTDVIQPAVSQAVTDWGSNYGWQLQPFPKENMLILNIPAQEGAIYYQYAMNTVTKAWGQFNGWNAVCWELFENNVYFGGNGYVGMAWSTFADNGGVITSNCLQAFNAFKAQGVNKQFTMLQPVFYTNGYPAVSTKINLDFDQSDPAASSSFSPSFTGGIWGSGLWGTAVWGGSNVSEQAWQGAQGVGKYGAPHIVATASGIELQWMATNIIFRPGGIL